MSSNRLSRFKSCRAWICVPAILFAALDSGVAQAGEVPGELETLTITATRLARPAFDTPASIQAVRLRPDSYGVNVADSLLAVPGLVARDRQNYAQDTQISVRGFGARSPFGIRGVRLYIDGIPATQPDGQGQVSHFNLATAERLEVLRGPYSALYGNSSGGVIQLFTADGNGSPSLQAGTAFGSADSWRVNVGSSGEIGGIAFNVGATRFATDGTRGHSAARRDSLQAKVSVPLHGGRRLTLLGNYLSAPAALDPLGLTQAQFLADPQQAAPVALQFNTRKSVEQWQAGVIHERELGPGQLRLSGYAGDRDVLQYLAIPAATQADPRHSGGVVDLAAQFHGGEVRFSGSWPTGSRTATLVGGISYDALRQLRRGYENFIGPTLGVAGALRRDESNTVRAFDQFLQLDWQLSDAWSAITGVRHSRIDFSSRDNYVRAGNPDDSGGASYDATTPVAGLLFKAKPQLNLYAAYGQGFETPTLAELAYRSDGSAGMNLALQSARTRNYEMGVKWRADAGAHAELALFRSDTERELIVVVNAGGRSAYSNAGRTRRQGVELALSAPLTSRWSAELSYTALQASVRDTYLTCTAVPCLAPNVPVAAGSRIPGVPQATLFTELRWQHPSGWQGTMDVRRVGSVVVNDVNAAQAAAFTLINAGLAYRWSTSRFRIETFVRLENIQDREYVGSVIVNDANGRFYEAGPARTIRVGFGARLM